MNLSKEIEKLKYDKRLLEWHVSRGLFPKDQAKKYLEGLPDLASNVEPVTLGQSSSSQDGQGSGQSQY